MKQLKRAGRFLCSMKCAIVLLLILVAACTAGSVIPQGQAIEWYTMNYSQQVAGAVLLLGLDDIFHCWWFLVLTLFLCLNLLGCNVLRFPSLVRRMKNGFTPAKCLAAWDGAAAAEIAEDPEQLFEKMGFRKIRQGKIAVEQITGKNSGTVEKNNETMGKNSKTAGMDMPGSEDTGKEATEKETTENETEYRYASKNKIGIWGAWLCHLGMLIVIAGFGLGQMLKTEYTVYGVPGQTKMVGDTGYELTIDSFEVRLREDATVEQYISEITVSDVSGQQIGSGETSVNAPLALAGMSFYQNSTGWAATAEIRKDGETLQETLLCAGEYILVQDMEGLAVVLNAFYPDYYEDESGGSMTLTPTLKNPGYLYTLYYHDQILGMNVLTGDEKITVEDYEIIFKDPQQYTLIQVKRDPFTSLAAIGAIVVLVGLLLAFYVRPQELFAVRSDDGRWRIGGKSRKAGILFAEEITAAISQMEDTKNGK